MERNSSLRVCTQNGFASQDLFRGKAACDWSGAHHVGPMPRTSTPSPADLPSPSARHLPRVRRGDGWDALADIEVFVFAVEAELEAMERERIGVRRFDTHTSDPLQPKFEERTVMDFEQPLGYMDAVVGIDTDQVCIERCMMDFRQRQPVGDHRLPVLLVRIHYDMRGVEQSGFWQVR